VRRKSETETTQNPYTFQTILFWYYQKEKDLVSSEKTAPLHRKERRRFPPRRGERDGEAKSPHPCPDAPRIENQEGEWRDEQTPSQIT
jgi:hypothetical protein